MSRQNVSAVKVGDRVLATCGESFIVGTVDGAYPEGTAPGFAVTVDGDISRYFPSDVWTVEVLAPPIPDVVGTIVRDADGDAWQCQEYAWYLADNDDVGRSLDDLQFYGPLTVLWTPEDTS